jgi:hypothetical protein
MRAMRTFRWTRAVGRACLLVSALVACGSHRAERAFLARRVPVARLDSVLRASDSVRLALTDARTLFAAVADSALALHAPHDTMTIAELVAWTRAEQAHKREVDAAAAAAERAREEEMKKELAPLLAATIVKKTYLPRDPASEQFEDYISLAFAYKNTGTKAIRAFQGDATFLDAFGDSIYSAHLRVDLALKPGQTRRDQPRIVRYNPYRVAHQRLRDTPLDKLKLVWQTTEILFADSSRLSLTPDHPGT